MQNNYQLIFKYRHTVLIRLQVLSINLFSNKHGLMKKLKTMINVLKIEYNFFFII